MRNEGITRIEAQAMIDASVSKAYQDINNIKGTIGNSAYVTDESVGAPGAGPSSYIHQVILLTARVSGIFLIGWNFPWNSGTTADVVTNTVRTIGWTAANWASIATTGKHVLTQATLVGVTGPYTGGAVNGGTTPGVYQATAPGTTIVDTVTGASSQTSIQTTYAAPTLTGLLTTQGMQWSSGDIEAPCITNTTTKTPFAIGSPVAIQFLISATNTITMTGGAAFWAYEMPVG